MESKRRIVVEITVPDTSVTQGLAAGGAQLGMVMSAVLYGLNKAELRYPARVVLLDDKRISEHTIEQFPCDV